MASKEAKEIANAFDLLFEACNNIKDHDQCDDCPLRYICLEDGDESVIGYADLISPSSWDEFLDYADNVEYKEAELLAQYSDMLRDMRRDEEVLERMER